MVLGLARPSQMATQKPVFPSLIARRKRAPVRHYYTM